ncbi:SusD/RagB family nutrient-binding outer membrane lipoprotein [Niabella sp. 22666]|uniref:SusD/RagB family nutrient-binding outer membrane lipoprotein n=1 Tax=Niabella sp. 22666 TaxID=3453954 RepID=UPI003F861824
MKRIYKLVMILGVLVFITSCKKYLDINKNPNDPTGSIDEIFLLPKAIVAWSRTMTLADVYGGEIGGSVSNPGGVSGFGSLITYNYGPGDYAGWWDLYDNIQDLNTIIAKANVDPSYLNYGAAAKIIRAIHFQALVDAYNNVPYTEANKGLENLTAEYDNGPDIYKSIAALIDEAISDFGKATSTALALNNATDPLFGGDMTRWKQLANTVKLRIILRGGNKVSISNKTFTADGFLAADAMVQPGFTNVDGKTNPTWGRVYNAAGTAQGGGLQQRVPTYYMWGFYDGTKINDKFRRRLVYRVNPPGLNQLGVDPGSSTAAVVKAPNDWYLSLAATPSATNYAALGIFKGPAAPQPVMLAAESYFLQAEGILKGLIATGTVKDAFNNGVLESFRYLNKDESGGISSKFVDTTTGQIAATAVNGRYIQINPQKEVAIYLSDNLTNRLVNFDLAVTDEEKLEAIITQKYIAHNMIKGDESWNEYRRTLYPVSDASSADRYRSFKSTQSTVLPTRLQYPAREFSYNADNVNAQKGTAPNGGMNVLADKIFWAK